MPEFSSHYPLPKLWDLEVIHLTWLQQTSLNLEKQIRSLTIIIVYKTNVLLILLVEEGTAQYSLWT